MLSQQNINKLKRNALYGCTPNPKYRSKWHEDNLYHCCNWTFTVVLNDDGEYFMKDTYWSGGGNSVYILLTDENIDEFREIFERDKVRTIRKEEAPYYDKYYKVPIDSGGLTYSKYFVDKDAVRNKDLILNEINEQIKNLEWQLKSLTDKKDGIKNGTYKLEWF